MGCVEVLGTWSGFVKRHLAKLCGRWGIILGALLCTGLSLFCIVGAAEACQVSASRQNDRPASPSCTVREVSRERLTTRDGHPLYIEPVVLVPSTGGDVLLAGTPNYLWKLDRSGTAVAGAADSIFGVVIDQDGRVRVVPAPVDAAYIVGIRAVARDDGTWAVVFAELEDEYEIPEGPGPVAHLWFGVLRGTEWVSLERLPRPSGGGVLRPIRSSSLARSGDTLAWAVPVKMTELISRIAFFERRDGRWSSELVGGPATPDSRPEAGSIHGALYPTLAHSDTLGLVLSVVQSDLAYPDGDHNSLLFFVRNHEWRRFRRVILGARDGPVHHPSVSFSPRGDVVTWWTRIVRSAPAEQHAGGRRPRIRREARAMVGRHLETRSTNAITIDRSIANSVVPLTTPAGRHLWVTDHVALPSREREIRFIGIHADTATVFGRIPNPFTGPFGAVWTLPSTVLISGPLLKREKKYVGTLLLRVRIDCGTTEIPQRARRRARGRRAYKRLVEGG